MKKRLIGSLLFGALIVSSSSVFVSCADYDDDINANKAEIQAVQTELNKLTSDLTALQTQLNSTKSDLERQLSEAKSSFSTQIADAKAELQAAINAKADQSTVDALSTKLANLEAAYTAKVASLDAQIAAINTAIANLEAIIANKADKSELTAAIATLQAAIDKKVDTETYNQAVALLQELKTNLSNLQTLVDTKASKEYVDSEVTKLNATITALQAALDGKVAATEFAALKSTVDAIQDAVKALQTAAANAATKDELNSVKSELNAAIAKLQEQINGYVTTEKLDAAINTLKIELQAAIDALKEGKADKADVAAMAVQIAGLEAVVANMLTQSDLDLLREQLTQLINANDAAINAKVDELFAALEAVVAANKQESKDADAELAAAIAALEASTNQSVADLKDADDILGALIGALAANAAELQDQIDDLKANKANKADFDAAVTELNKAKSDIADILVKLTAINGDIDAINSNYAALIAQIAGTDAATDAAIAALNTKIEGLENGKVAANAAAIAALQLQADAISTFLGELTEGGLAAQLEALKQAMSADATAKVNAEIADRVAAISEVVGKINEVKTDLASLDSKLYDPATGDITTLKAQMAQIDTKIQEAVEANLANLKLFIVRMLSSVTLIPELYIGGIEAIEFQSIQYFPQARCADANHEGVSNDPFIDGQTYGWTHNAPRESWKYIGNEDATAQYRVSPANVDEETFIVNEIEVVANKALTRATGLCTSPVEVIKDKTTYDKATGVVRIYLKKAQWFQGRDLNTYGLDANEIYTVSLRVPRNAKYYNPTDADGEVIAQYVYSEFSRLQELKIRPYIAELFADNNDANKANFYWRYNGAYHHNMYSNQNQAHNGGAATVNAHWGDHAGWGPLKNVANQKGLVRANNETQHYLDSVTVFSSKVDNDEYVKAELLYNEEFELNKMVDGCYDPTVGRLVDEELGAGAHSRITAEKLKTYGLAFRFAIPNRYYGNQQIVDVDHITNQNKFALLRYNKQTGKTYIRSAYVTANGTASIDARNAACVGKEPIIRISLVDTINGKLVDERYMKIKWRENILPAVQLDPKESEAVLNCLQMQAQYTWSEFINKVYAVANENAGMSQSTFEGIYPWNQIRVTNISGFDAAVNPKPAPVFQWTNNLNGDALIGTWTLTPDDVRRIFKGSITDTRSFTCRVTFNSTSKTEHPDMYFDWTFKITLPTLPAINGFYNNYWLDESTHGIHYVLPVQYGTAQYNKLTNVEPAYAQGVTETPDGFVPNYDPANNVTSRGDKYCVFDNNLMNAFTYDVNNNVTRFIVKNIYDGCQSWDLQFRQIQKEDGYRSGYYTSGYRTQDWNDGYKVNAGVDYLEGAGLQNNANGMMTWEPDVIMANENTATVTNAYAADPVHATCDVTSVTPDVTPSYKLYKATTAATQDGTTLAARLIWLQGHSQWDGDARYKNANLVVDHVDWNNNPNTSALALLNPLQDDNEADGWTPLKTNAKQVRMAVWATLNKWNHVPVWFYNIALVEPIRLNANLGGVFEDGWVSGTAVEYDQALTLTDFRGYLVRATAPSAAEALVEKTAYTDKLYKYYEIGAPVWQPANTRYGFKYENGQIVADDNLTWSNGMTAAELYTRTNGNIDLSITLGKSVNNKDALVFKNNGGSNVETQVNVFIPVSIRYGFGTMTRYCKVRLYKKGTADQTKVIRGEQAPARQK